MTTVALVAAKDAAGSIAATVRALGSLREVDEVWVVDDGSTDDTAVHAANAGARVVRLEMNQGKGAAVAAGVAATPHADRYLLADADLGATASGLRALFAAPDAAVVVGVLPHAGRRGGFGAVKRMARFGIRRACGVVCEAPLSGQRLVDGPLLRSLRLASRFGIEVGMTIDAVRAGAALVEVPVAVDHRHTGRRLAGFRHRGRQGADIAAALVPRLATPRQRVAAIFALGLVLMAVLSLAHAVTAAPRGTGLPSTDKVVVFGFDHAGLADLQRSDLPALRGLGADGVTGALSVRTTDRRSLDRRSGPERPSPLDAYASLGASARVRAVPELAQSPGDAGRAMAAARSLARRDKAASLPGALGDALHRRGMRTALVAGPQRVGDFVNGYPAAAALADRHGRIDTIAIPAPVPSGGTDIVAAVAGALRQADVVFVDPGLTAGTFDAPLSRLAALRRTDAILAGVQTVLPPRTLLVVFSPTPPGVDWALTPIVVRGDGLAAGTIASPATRRNGLGVITDLAPTILQSLGVAPTTEMTGSALRRGPGQYSPAAYERMTTDGAVRGRFFLGASVGYTVAAIALYLSVGAALALRPRERAWTALRVLVCAAAAFAPALLLTAAMQHWLHVGGESPLVLVATCAGFGLLVSFARGLRPLYWCAATVVAITAIDVAVTGPIHTASLLGYSIQTTGRFYGLPNASFSVFASSVVVLAAAMAGGWRRSVTPVRAAAAATMLFVGCSVVGAPWLGNDVGGTVALVPVSAALVWRFAGRRLSRRGALAGAAAVAAGLTLLLAAEVVVGGGTHLSRVFRSDGVTNALAHRVDVNVGLLVDQWWGFLVFALVGVALFAIGRGWLPAAVPVGSPLRAAVAGLSVLSVAAFVVNDSGPVVSVLCVVVAAPLVALRLIDAGRLRRSRR